MIKLINSDKNKNYLVTIAIGKKLFSDWKKYAYQVGSYIVEKMVLV